MTQCIAKDGKETKEVKVQAKEVIAKGTRAPKANGNSTGTPTTREAKAPREIGKEEKDQAKETTKARKDLRLGLSPATSRSKVIAGRVENRGTCQHSAGQEKEM